MSQSARWVIAILASLFWTGFIGRGILEVASRDAPLAERFWFIFLELLVLALLVLPYLGLAREIRSGPIAWGVAVCLVATHLTLGTASILEEDALGGGFLIFYAILAGVGITLVGRGIDINIQNRSGH